MNVDAASPLALVIMVSILTRWKIQMAVITDRLIRFDARAADVPYEKPADQQRGIADRFGGESIAGLSSEQAIIGVSSEQIGRRDRRLPISSTHYQQFHQMFDIPVAFDKLYGKVV